ncbi:MAG: HAD family phosphatase [Muribaculaceae bacterium]|nr:HAD family phosphatase [Muribaculaceae bacterium]
MQINMPMGEFLPPRKSDAEFYLETPIMEIKGIKNIIFDLGGVVIDLDRNRAVEALKALGLHDADSLLGLYRQEEPFLGLETGRVEAGEFFDLIRSKCPGASDAEITKAFDSFLIGIPVARLQRLRALRRAGYRLYVLSNTNPVMYNGWITDAFRAEGLTVNDYFDGIVASFQELTCKPDPIIFERVLTRYNLRPEETLMLDDSEANCDAARSVGMPAIRIGRDRTDDMLAVTYTLIQALNHH